jgi:hypothetical protein
MNLGLAIADGIVELALVAVSVYGAVTLPPGSRVPLHHGIGGWNNWQPKTIALIAWPAIGVVVFALLLTATHGASSGGKSTPAFVVPVVLLVVTFSYYSAIKAAMRENRRD